jgi:hypothetical protein
MQQTIAELEAQIAALKKAEREALEKQRMSVLPRFTFTFTISPEARRWNCVADDSGVEVFNLVGTLANEAELQAVGASTERLGGAMSYFVNTATPTPRIVCSTGGGRVWIKSARWGLTPEQMIEAQGMTRALEAFLTENPEGGDVTELMTYWGAQPVRTEKGYSF